MAKIMKNPPWGKRYGYEATYDSHVAIDRATKRNLFHAGGVLWNIGVAVVDRAIKPKIVIYGHTQVSNGPLGEGRLPPTYMVLDRDAAESLFAMLAGALAHDEPRVE